MRSLNLGDVVYSQWLNDFMNDFESGHDYLIKRSIDFFLYQKHANSEWGRIHEPQRTINTKASELGLGYPVISIYDIGENLSVAILTSYWFENKERKIRTLVMFESELYDWDYSD